MKQFKINLLLMLFSLFLTRGFAQVTTAAIGDALTLKQAIDIAIGNNLVVEQSDIARQQARVNKNQAYDYMLPSISANGSQTISIGRSLNPYTYSYVNQQINYGNYGINGNLLLFSGLQVQNIIKQNSLNYDASKLDLEQQKQNITLSVLLQYLQVVSSQDLLDISRKQADVDKEQLDRLDLQNKDGALVDLSALSDLKGQYATDLANIASNVNTLEGAKISLFQFLNVPYKRDVQFEKIPLDLQMTDYQGNPDSIYHIAMGVLPSIRSTDLRVKAAQKGVAVSRSIYYPSLSFTAGIGTSYSNAATLTTPAAGFFNDTSRSSYISTTGGDYYLISKNQNTLTQNISFSDQFRNNRATTYGLSLSIPILNQLRTRNNVKLSKINLQNAQYTATATKLGLQQSVEQAYQTMVMASSQLKSDQDALDGYAESFRIKEIKFNEGVITSDIYLLAKNAFDRATITLTIAKYNYIFRSKILDYYQGKLTY